MFGWLFGRKKEAPPPQDRPPEPHHWLLAPGEEWRWDDAQKRWVKRRKGDGLDAAAEADILGTLLTPGRDDSGCPGGGDGGSGSKD